MNSIRNAPSEIAIKSTINEYRNPAGRICDRQIEIKTIAGATTSIKCLDPQIDTGVIQLATNAITTGTTMKIAANPKNSRLNSSFETQTAIVAIVSASSGTLTYQIVAGSMLLA